MKDFVKDFAERLKEALADQGREERDRAAYLAKICKVSGTAAGKWLSGESLPGMENAFLLEAELGVCVEWLLMGTGPKKPPSNEAVDWFNMLESLPPREKAIVERMLVRMSNLPPRGRKYTWTEFLQMFKAAGATAADIALVSGPVQEGLRRSKPAEAVIAPFPGRRLPP